MTVRELINKLLDCDMNAVITVCTSNKDSQGRLHHYEFTVYLGYDEMKGKWCWKGYGFRKLLASYR